MDADEKKSADGENRPKKKNSGPEWGLKAPRATKEDVEKNKVMAIVGYIVPILFFVPLVSESSKDSPFAKFHAGQQLSLLLFWIIGWVLSAVLMVVLIGFLIEFIVWVAGLVFMILGVIHAANGEMKPLPFIGNIKII